MTVLKWLLSVVVLLSLVGLARGAEPVTAKLSVLIIDGMNNHDWPRATQILKGILHDSGRFAVDVSTTPQATAPRDEWDAWRPAFSKYDVVVNNFNGGEGHKGTRWPHEVEAALEEYVRNGGGLVVYHAANNAFLDWPAYNDMIGLGWRNKNFGPGITVDAAGKLVEIPQGQGNNPGHPSEYDFQITTFDADQPITRGMPKVWLHPHEQLTHGQHGPMKNLTLLTYAYAKDTHQNEPMDWVVQYGKGRVYTTMLGHLWKAGPDITLRCIGFQTLFIRGTEWAATGKVTYPIPADFPTATEIRTKPVAEVSTPPAASH
jgi:uncharacterized protein